MNIQLYKVETAMGSVLRGESSLPFLSKKELKELNNIGYTGKNSKGIKTTRGEYLNTLNKGTFQVDQTKYDNGNFVEGFTIVRVTN